jgi:hypothetical protein
MAPYRALNLANTELVSVTLANKEAEIKPTVAVGLPVMFNYSRKISPPITLIILLILWLVLLVIETFLNQTMEFMKVIKFKEPSLSIILLLASFS